MITCHFQHKDKALVNLLSFDMLHIICVNIRKMHDSLTLTDGQVTVQAILATGLGMRLACDIVKKISA